MSASARHPLPLDRWGPDRCESMDEPQSRAWCRRFAASHSENFPVLTALVPEDRRDDFAALYAFCRWADDLGDESGTPERAMQLLQWWRTVLSACVAGDPPRHPVFLALSATIRRHQIPAQPFHDLITAFEMDQSVTRFATWSEVEGYCRLSADPVGRLVLMILGEPRDAETFALSDRICTGLQLANHWQDIRRDRVERNRVYVPAEVNPIPDFERRLEVTVRQGFACDPTFLEESRRLVAALVDRTWPFFDEGRRLLERVSPSSRPVIEMFIEGGESVLTSIARWNFETVLHRPRITAPMKAWMVARAWVRVRLAGLRGGGGTSAPHAALGGGAR